MNRAVLHVGQQLRFVNTEDFLDCLHFNDHAFVDYQIGTIRVRNEMFSKYDRDVTLSLDFVSGWVSAMGGTSTLFE